MLLKTGMLETSGAALNSRSTLTLAFLVSISRFTTARVDHDTLATRGAFALVLIA